ncbi:MAG TPA: GntR family transcriptional regulator [Firmicutes bacterium]|nr:GntR family transcriptional regulator [Bacillota bacterium]
MEVRLSGKRNIFEEIAQEYERFIRLGALREGEKLPSVRALAMQLGVNPNTVERAYALLEQRGLVVTLPKKGVFVCAPHTESAAVSEARRHIRSLKHAGLKKEELLAVVEEVYGGEGEKE